MVERQYIQSLHNEGAEALYISRLIGAAMVLTKR